MTPNLWPAVQQIAGAFPHLLSTNTYASCCEFTQRVLMACGDPAWGHVSKTQGEGQFTPSGFQPRDVLGVDGTVYRITGVSHDAIFHKPTNQIVDLLGNGSANSDPDPTIHGPAFVQWALIPQHLNRPNNPWMPTIVLGGSSTPVPVPPPMSVVYPGDVFFTEHVGIPLHADYSAAGQLLNAGSATWFARTIWDIVHEGLTAEASVQKHRNEWRAALGLPPL